MGAAEVLLVAVGLSMDAFAVSVCKGLGMRRIDWYVAFVLAAAFGGFQALMPAIGWLVGSQFMWVIEPIDHWIAFGLLVLIGANMIREAVQDDEDGVEEGQSDRIDVREVLMLAIATSIDALAVGISLAALGEGIIFPVVVIGITTFLLSIVGVVVGNLFGSRYERIASVIGGVVLIAIGLKILLEHLGFLAF